MTACTCPGCAGNQAPERRPTATDIALYINDLESAVADSGMPVHTELKRMRLVRDWADRHLPDPRDN